MTLAILPTGQALGRPLSPDGAPRPQPVGPGWEVLLMPELLADLVAQALKRTAVAASALGWVFAHAGQRGIFLPEFSDVPAWPPGTTYLKAGASVTLPPYHWQLTDRDNTSGWVSQDGPPLSKPLLLHPIFALIAAGMPNCASSAPES
ncbi:hypothetical protein ABZ023_18800 [Streptomyces sp. NPDC006367]|uniref:hypothetical protein n=1 Tax=unclassified Streptomyces TaxID=2593676 RepID=UPI0033BD5FB5